MPSSLVDELDPEIRRTYEKLNVSSRMEAIYEARPLGLLGDLR